MGWLLELLLEGIREICSQFIVDMMELVTEMFTELLSCNLSLFEELFSVVTVLYQNVIVPMGIAILLLILVWQLFKSMFGKSVNGEEPIELLIRSAISLFFVIAAKPLVNYILRVAGTPYQWVVGTEIEVESFSGFVSALEGVTETLGIGSLSIALLMLIMQFVVAWNYFKMLFVIAERYVLLGVFSYTAPLAFSTGGSKSTNNILGSWAKMFGGQVVLIILNAWCMKMFLSGYGNMMASTYGFTKFFVATLCLVGFCKITFKLDSYMASLGVNLGRPSAGMGAMGLIMAASRIFSQIGKSGDSTNGGGSPEGGETSQAAATGGMTEEFAGPIPMTPGEEPKQSMNMADTVSEDFDTPPSENGYGEGSGYTDQPAETGVLDELGITAEASASAQESDTGVQSDMGAGIGRMDQVESDAAIDSSNNPLSGQEEAPMEIGYSTIPGYEEEAGHELAQSGSELNGAEGGLEQTGSIQTGDGSVQTEIGFNQIENSEDPIAEAMMSAESVAETGYTGSDAGIISEIGDYPVEENIVDGVEDVAMELEGNTIESMSSGIEREGVSSGAAGDVYGNTTLASRSGIGTGRNTEMAAGAEGAIHSTELSGTQNDMFEELGAGFETEGLELYGNQDLSDAATNALEDDGDFEQMPRASFNYMDAAATTDSSVQNENAASEEKGFFGGEYSEQNENGNPSMGGELLSGEPTFKAEKSEEFSAEMEGLEEPEEQPEGQMNPLSAGCIPSGDTKAQEDGQASRGSWEVPKSRRDLPKNQEHRSTKDSNRMY